MPTYCRIPLHFPNFLSFPTDYSIKHDPQGTPARYSHPNQLRASHKVLDSPTAKTKCMGNSGKNHKTKYPMLP